MLEQAHHRITVETKGPGFKYAEYELRGACTRIDLGPKDLEKAQGMLTRRDTKVSIHTRHR